MSSFPPVALTRFDLLLASIGASLLAGPLFAVVVGFPLYVATALGSVVASAFLFDGLVRNPPTD